MSALCRRLDISRPTGYKWLRRYREEGAAGLEERSRCPNRSPNRTSEPVVKAVCEVRKRHPSWGGRKIRARLQAEADQEETSLPFGPEEVPAASTCQMILKRNGLIDSDSDQRHAPFERFEKEAPNQLWQMDFKGHCPLVDGTRCHALTIVDDHSRFALHRRLSCAVPTSSEQRSRSGSKPSFSATGFPDAFCATTGCSGACPR